MALPHDQPHPHALIIGGTGMLRGTCTGLAARGFALTLIARSQSTLDATALAYPSPARVLTIPLDYRDSTALSRALVAAVSAHGAIDLAVCWIHSDAPSAPTLIAAAIANPRRPPRFFHVLPCEEADPSQPHDPHTGLADRPGLLYRRVILGWIPGATSSRWLTDEEISSGALAAIDTDLQTSTIGTVEPWSARP